MISRITSKTRNAGLENTCIFQSKTVLVLFFVLLIDTLINPIHINAQQYISHTYLLEFSAENRKSEPVLTPADWHKRRKQIIEGMQLAMGKLPDRHDFIDLDVKIVSETKGEGYIRQTINFASGSGDRIPALLYIPAGKPNPIEPR